MARFYNAFGLRVVVEGVIDGRRGSAIVIAINKRGYLSRLAAWPVSGSDEIS
jgi:hypothetical protein